MRLTDAEWIVMNAIWDRPVESSVRDVLEIVTPLTGWAYPTVQTIMVRLAKKKALRSRLRANTRLYTAVVTRLQARRTAIRSLLDLAFRGSAKELVKTILRGDWLAEHDRNEIAAEVVPKQDET
jgi:BlaI family penicillinase repressor